MYKDDSGRLPINDRDLAKFLIDCRKKAKELKARDLEIRCSCDVLAMYGWVEETEEEFHRRIDEEIVLDQKRKEQIDAAEYKVFKKLKTKFESKKVKS